MEKSLEIQRGLFLIKYESAEDPDHPPKVTVSVAKADGHISIISAPDFEEGALWSPGGCLAVRATQAGSLRVEVTPSISRGSVAARVQLIPLSSDPIGARDDLESEPWEVNPSSLRVLGHVAGIGDVSVGAGEWIAGPTAPSRIEGIALEWPRKPPAINIKYAVRVGGRNVANTPFVDLGEFAGTRGKSLPLVGATLEISGDNPNEYELAVDAIFLGSPKMRVTGQRVVLSGPTGREPLVGLCVAIENSDQNQAAVKPKVGAGRAERMASRPERAASRQERTASRQERTANRPERPPDVPAQTPAAIGKRTGKVRVFRSSAKQGHKN